MKKVGCLFVFVVLAVLMFVTNPSEQAHIDNAYTVLREKGMDKFGINSDYLVVGEGLLGREQMDDLLKKFIKRKNYYLFSVTEIDLMGEKHNVALGLFGRLWSITDL